MQHSINILLKLFALRKLNLYHHVRSIFRKTDYFRDMADEYNKALKQIQQLQWNLQKEKRGLVSEPHEDDSNVVSLKKVS